MNGANMNKGDYEPDVTSYDYDAPLDESGRPTAKYDAFRSVIAKATGTTPPPVPDVAPRISFPSVKLMSSASLWNNLPAPIQSEQVLSMEDVDQAYGYILYRTRLKEAAGGDLVLDELHSYAQIYLDRKLVGTLDRRLKQNHLTLPANPRDAELDILVENTGRVNFGRSIGGERAGITRQVTLNGTPLVGWQIFPLPMQTVERLDYSKEPCQGACFYRGYVNLAAVGDTFLDTSEFTKGELWLNGRALGRIWSIGPQRTLYAPGPWLKQGRNEVIVFDLQGRSGSAVRGRATPVLDATPSEVADTRQ
jgi:beta-galactosidase